jgi:hypothetical protein
MAARDKPIAGRLWTPEIVRHRIKTSLIVRALIEHTLGQREMVASQVTAGLGLLKKVIPDLSVMDLKNAAANEIRDIDTAELIRRISALEGAISPQASQSESAEVH